MFWVARLTVGNFPIVQEIHHKATLDEALATGTTMALEHDAPDTADKIRQELEEGVYVPSKHAEWSICYGEVDVPVEFFAPKPDAFADLDARKEAEAKRPKKKWGQGYSDGKRR